MSDEQTDSPFIGKFVCYNAFDGGACWGRIKSECVINTMSGEKEAFILEGRVMVHLRAAKGITAKIVTTGIPTPTRTIAVDPTTGKASDDIVMEVIKCKGDTLIRKDVIDLDRDVIDLDEVLEQAPEDVLFLALMKGQEDGVSGELVEKNKALELGLKHMSNSGLEESIKKALKNRMEKR